MKLWQNGLFYTMIGEDETVEAVVTNAGEISRTGTVKELKAYYGDQLTETIDLDGGTVFPGFVDSHLHLLWYGQSLARLNLKECETKQLALQMITERVMELGTDEWLFVEGYNENKWIDDATAFTQADLTRLSKTNPILVRRIDYHNVVINQAFTEKIGIQKNQLFDGGGEIVLDASGNFTGVLKDEATNLAINAFPESTSEEMEEYLTLAIQDLWSKGITGGHSEDLHYFNGFFGTFATFKESLGEHLLPFRAHLLIHNAELKSFVQSGEQFLDSDPFVELGAMKIFYDGTVGSRTALMEAGYDSDSTNHGLQIQTDEQFTRMVREARQAGLPVAIHILGDLAFEKVITTLRQYPPADGQMDRMIHTPWLRPNLLDLAKGLPLLFDVQPQFMSSDLPWALDVLGPNHPPLAFAWKSIQQAGFPLAGGSDAPVEIPNPFLGIHAAVTRTVSSDLNGHRYFPAEALSVYEAISLYTIGSAIADYHSDTRGKIQAGYVADFTVVKENPFMIPIQKLNEVKVIQTVVSEKVVYKG
ncbi:amidohydrolase [Carnobacterium gallinarum]|uniref:amidohydrolase n=1 Tax=Carnobacterium gallinarum TaxID=2749 RepID=UPI00055735C2|nr:amidohydrolase [Carnobacterium gallinarum]